MEHKKDVCTRHIQENTVIRTCTHTHTHTLTHLRTHTHTHTHTHTRSHTHKHTHTHKRSTPTRGHWCCSSAITRPPSECRGHAQTSRRTSNRGQLQCGFATRRPQCSSRGQVQRRGCCDLPRRCRRRTSGNDRYSGKVSSWCAISGSLTEYTCIRTCIYRFAAGQEALHSRLQCHVAR